MTKKLEETCRNLGTEIAKAEKELTNTGRHLATASQAELEHLEAGLVEVRARFDSERDSATQAIQRVKEWAEGKKDEALSTLETWKTDREIAKIEKHADKSEQQAVDAVMAAAYAILEAEVAVLEALKARKMAIEVAG